MLVVPLSGDTIETSDGLKFTVLSYNPWKERGAAVHVEHTPGVPSDAVYFFDIKKINGVHVKRIAGGTLKAEGKIRRKIHLPQPHDIITVQTSEGPQKLRVISIIMRSKALGLGGGIRIKAEDNQDNESLVRLVDVIDINRASGSDDLFGRDRMLSVYKEYLGSTK